MASNYRMAWKTLPGLLQIQKQKCKCKKYKFINNISLGIKYTNTSICNGVQLQVGVEEAARIIGVLFTNCFEFKLAHIEVKHRF